MMKNVRLGIIALCFLLVLSVTVFAGTNCPTKEEYRVMIKEAVNDYFSYPSHEKLMQLQDMLKVYATHDFTQCLEEETEYSFTQICSDGTAYGSCSVTKPLYCDNGNLVDNCQVCGCDANFGCQGDGGCVALTCSDGTLYDQCSSTKPLFCQNGTLVNMCNICGCNENQICKIDESCLNKVEAKQTILLVVQADKILAEKALEAAENTPVKYPEKYEVSVQQEIETAKQLLAQANIEAEQGEHAKSIGDYGASWEHSQKAVEFANREKPTCASRVSKGCYNDDVYWYDSCGLMEDVYEDCSPSQKCANGQCVSRAEWCERCSNIKPCTRVRWFDSSGGCDDDYYNQRTETPDDSCLVGCLVEAGYTCRNGQCVCVPNCLNRQCGSNGCGGSCGTCPSGQSCWNGKCISGCREEGRGCWSGHYDCCPGLFCRAEGYCAKQP